MVFKVCIYECKGKIYLDKRLVVLFCGICKIYICGECVVFDDYKNYFEFFWCFGDVDENYVWNMDSSKEFVEKVYKCFERKIVEFYEVKLLRKMEFLNLCKNVID